MFIVSYIKKNIQFILSKERNENFLILKSFAKLNSNVIFVMLIKCRNTFFSYLVLSKCLILFLFIMFTHVMIKQDKCTRYNYIQIYEILYDFAMNATKLMK